MIEHIVNGSKDTTWVEGLEVSIDDDGIRVALGTYHMGEGDFVLLRARNENIHGGETGVFLIRLVNLGGIVPGVAEIAIGFDGALPPTDLLIDRLAWFDVITEEWHVVKVVLVEEPE